MQIKFYINQHDNKYNTSKTLKIISNSKSYPRCTTDATISLNCLSNHTAGILLSMNTSIPNNDIPRLLRNLIRIGTIAEVDLEAATCRVNTGGNVTDWLHWLTARAGRSRSWWAPSIGEQVLLFCLGGELDTAFVMPAVFSDEFPAPSGSADALHVTFPDGAVIEYEPKTGALQATGIKSATVNASEKVAVTAPDITCTAKTRITLDSPEVVCTHKLTTAAWR